jgi:hypothetical protein
MMVAAIDLDQLAEAVPAVAWLVNPCRALAPRYPQADVGHQFADGFL